MTNGRPHRRPGAALRRRALALSVALMFSGAADAYTLRDLLRLSLEQLLALYVLPASTSAPRSNVPLPGGRHAR